MSNELGARVARSAHVSPYNSRNALDYEIAYNRDANRVYYGESERARDRATQSSYLPSIASTRTARDRLVDQRCEDRRCERCDNQNALRRMPRDRRRLASDSYAPRNDRECSTRDARPLIDAVARS